MANNAAENLKTKINGPLKIGILAGGGALPSLVAASAVEAGHSVHIVGIEGETGPDIQAYSHDWTKWGQIGHIFSSLHDNGCTDVVIIGSVRRPDLRKVRIDLGAIRSLPFILSVLTGGDDSILTSVVGYFEKHGLRIRGAHEIAPSLLAGTGHLAGPVPTENNLADIEKGRDVVDALGRHDVGQGAVVARQYVLGVEAAEGTDELLRRCGDLRQWGTSWFQRKRVGVLVKAPKPGQELRVDMPTFGPTTVQLLADAGLAGLAVTAGSVLVVDQAQTYRLANETGIFILGMEPR